MYCPQKILTLSGVLLTIRKKEKAIKEHCMIKEYIYDVSGDWPGNVFLAAGKTNCLFDAGLACCADKMVENIEKILRGRTLDYVFLTHSHFDHVSGIPRLRKRWPKVKVFIAPHGKEILDKPSARKRMRRLNEAAAEGCGMTDLHYCDEDLYADDVLTDGQMFGLDEWKITAIDTPGHTRDSFSFLIEREGCAQNILLCSETAGAYAKGNFISPCFLLGYHMSVESMKKMQAVGADLLIFAHTGFASEDSADESWKHCFSDHEWAFKTIRAEARRDIPVEDKINHLAEIFWPKALHKYQPYPAYFVNMSSMLERAGEEDEE